LAAANPSLNSMANSRNLTLAGYEVYRFGADDLRNANQARATLTRLFADLFRRHHITATADHQRPHSSPSLSGPGSPTVRLHDIVGTASLFTHFRFSASLVRIGQDRPGRRVTCGCAWHCPGGLPVP
jgi:hypothetical protein